MKTGIFMEGGESEKARKPQTLSDKIFLANRESCSLCLYWFKPEDVREAVQKILERIDDIWVLEFVDYDNREFKHGEFMNEIKEIIKQEMGRRLTEKAEEKT